MKQITIFIILVTLISGLIVAQDDVPSVTVMDQVSTNGMVVVPNVFSDGPGFVVIHTANDEGKPGPVVGYRAVNDGVSNNVAVDIDTSMATSTLFAMLHVDTGEVGVFEFGKVEGADGPARVDEAVVVSPFAVEILATSDQYIDSVLTVSSVVTAQDGFVVIHSASDDGGPGPVIGYAAVSAGNNSDVMVELDADGVTPVVFPMLHVDTGEAGVYEFGKVEGADGPVKIGERVAVMPVQVNTPSMTVHPQIVSDSLVAASVVSEGDGWLVIHSASDEGGPGPVIGYTAVVAGNNSDVMVELNTDGLTPVVFPMLHVDTGEVGVYDFGKVEGADGPVIVGERPLVFPVNVAPSFNAEGMLDGTTLTVKSALIDAQGWLVIHADDGEGKPGPLLGYAPLIAGNNINIVIELSDVTDTLFPMLHYDTGEQGMFEFGKVEGADGPVKIGQQVVVGPMQPTSVE